MPISADDLARYDELAREAADALGTGRELVYLTRMREHIGYAKCNRAVQWIRDFCDDSGKQLVVGAEHIKVQLKILAALVAAGMTTTALLGDTTVAAVEREKARFERATPR